MNLVSFEFVACQEENQGVLVLSEFAVSGRAPAAGVVPRASCTRGAQTQRSWRRRPDGNSVGLLLSSVGSAVRLLPAAAAAPQGSAQSFGGAIQINPWNISEMAESFHQALGMRCTAAAPPRPARSSEPLLGCCPALCRRKRRREQPRFPYPRHPRRDSSPIVACWPPPPRLPGCAALRSGRSGTS